MASVKKWVTNKDVTGKAAVTKNFSGGVYAFDAKGNFIRLFLYATKGVNYGIASGRGVEMSDGITYYLITLKNKVNTYEFAYVSNQDFYFSAVRVADEAAAKNDAQKLFNSLIESDKKLLLQITTNNELIQTLAKRGAKVDDEARQLTAIINAYTARQQAIKTNPAIKVVNYFKISGIGCNCNQNKQIGLGPIFWGVAIGAGIVLAGLTVYYFLKPEYNVSQLHSKYLVENEAALKAKLGEKEFTVLKNSIDKEIKENATTAYDEGKSETLTGTIKNVGLMALGFFLLTKFQNSGRKAA